MAAALTGLLLGAGACGGKDGVKHESAADIEAAHNDGRETARQFVNRPWRDTLELQRALLEARAEQSKYTRAGRQESAAAFDSAFVSTLRTIRPDVARELQTAMDSVHKNTPAK